jgi:hypothetical protein
VSDPTPPPRLVQGAFDPGQAAQPGKARKIAKPECAAGTMHQSGTITGGIAPKFSFRYETVWRGASGRGGTQAEALAKKRGKAQRDCNKAQQGERHIFGGVEPIHCLLVECARHKIRAEGDQNVSRA